MSSRHKHTSIGAGLIIALAFIVSVLGVFLRMGQESTVEKIVIHRASCIDIAGRQYKSYDCEFEYMFIGGVAPSRYHRDRARFEGYSIKENDFLYKTTKGNRVTFTRFLIND